MSKEINWTKINHLLDLAENNLMEARQLIFEQGQSENSYLKCEEKAIEGIFNGEQMTTVNNKRYPVPVNYASKSKLVVGDLLKLTIESDGSFIYKQIKPAARKKITGVLTKIGKKCTVKAMGKNYHILAASITYHQAKVGDRVTIIVPLGEETSWAAFENVIVSKKGEEK